MNADLLHELLYDSGLVQFAQADLKDLNVLREIVNALPDHLALRYARYLQIITTKGIVPNEGNGAALWFCNADWSQKVQALTMTLS